MARELLLAQASDWAFLMKTGTAREYATKRTKDHVLRFTRLYDQLLGGEVDPAFLKHCEGRDNLFPDLNWRYHVGSLARGRVPLTPEAQRQASRRRVGA
jgi:1,4-alpha-glucan branching enzyme